ncbi:MAG: malate synthase A [Gemmatimonadaceae bacterium]
MPSVRSEQIEITGSAPPPPSLQRVLTNDAVDLIVQLHREFSGTRMDLLKSREQRQAELDRGVRPDFLPASAHIRNDEWLVAPAPADLVDRRVEITGPVERKMMINALNSGANAFMADLEDSLSPTWENVIEGQANLMDAVRRKLEYTGPDGKAYRLNEELATLIVRPRGWHLVERHMMVDGEPVSASLFDFGLYFFHNARELLDRGSGPYFYLPKLETHLEARLWNDVFNATQDALSIPRGTIRATVLIETILAAFEMDEILFELRDHAAGLNAGRWDYIFSIIKKFRAHSDFVLPDRSQVTMTLPFMRAYTDHLVKTCHRRGAHAMGGMAAFVPSRRDADVNEMAFKKVRDDKLRESADGFDGTWVAHPDLVPVAKEVFDRVLGGRPNQKDRQRPEVSVSAKDLLDVHVASGTVTEAGIRSNVDIAIQYLEAWLRGSGAVAIYNLMEDTATAEISRAQLWQWIRHGVQFRGRPLGAEAYEVLRTAELRKLSAASASSAPRYRSAAKLLDSLVLGDPFIDFLTVPGSQLLDRA